MASSSSSRSGKQGGSKRDRGGVIGVLMGVVRFFVDFATLLPRMVWVTLRSPVMWRIATRNLVANGRRTLMLGGAIGTVTMVLVVLSSVSNGMQVNMLKIATTLASGHVNVGGFYKMTSGDATPMLADYPKLLKHLESRKEERTMVGGGQHRNSNKHWMNDYM